ncbi:MAG: hypothetical protein MZV64_20620 [Ignavibacteriales bacterium]|nr:hypothetical protein [Ignavibacteriales bacterium]
MNSFMDKCCNECWHSPEKPMRYVCKMLYTKDRFAIKNDECKHKYLELNKRLRYESHDVPIIFIGMGTCGLASGAAKVEEAIRAELNKLEHQGYRLNQQDVLVIVLKKLLLISNSWQKKEFRTVKSHQR